MLTVLDAQKELDEIAKMTPGEAASAYDAMVSQFAKDLALRIDADIVKEIIIDADISKR